MNNQPLHDDANNSTELTSSTSASSSTKPVGNKKLILGVAAGLGLLFLILIALLIALLGKNNPDSGAQTTVGENSSSAPSEDSASPTAKKIARTYKSEDGKLEMSVYEPRQTGTNTTIDFSVKNICDGCKDTTRASDITDGFDDRTDSYLLDENAGKKYSTITDEDDNVLSTPKCNKWLKYGESVNCFVAFSKVPSGTTVSWVYRDVRVDSIKVK